MSIDNTLQQRGTRYGEFTGHARITQNLKLAMQMSPNWGLLQDDQKEALEMTAHKIGRILNGDPNYHDSWHDIIGYIRLVEKRLDPKSTDRCLKVDSDARTEAAEHAAVNQRFAEQLKGMVTQGAQQVREARETLGAVCGAGEAGLDKPAPRTRDERLNGLRNFLDMLAGAGSIEVVFLGETDEPRS